jgi:selenide, water dikinase
VVRLSDELALVQTVDFFTPIVDDPSDFGRVAAANSLSDVYAMGGSPLVALNIVCFPEDILPPEVLGEILRGGDEVVRAAGAILGGGHTVSDSELKYGLAVTGTIHPERMWTNDGARVGDRIFLTKALGTGMLATAGKKGLLSAEDNRALIESMSSLNASGARAALCLREGRDHDPIHAATDVTGFGLLGSCVEVARASKLHIRIDSSSLPILSGAQQAADSGCRTRGERNNLDYLGDDLKVADDLDSFLRSLALDPQTSGGLLLFVDPAHAASLEERLKDEGCLANACIGEVSDGPGCVELF